MTIKTLSKVALVAAIPFVFGQANAQQAAAAKAAKQLIKPSTAAGKTAAKPQLKVVNPADIQGVMSVSVAETILNQDKSGKELVNFLNTESATSRFSQSEIDTIKEAAARGLLKVKASVNCIDGLESEVSQRRYVKVVNSALGVLQTKGIGFNTAIKDANTLNEISVALTNTLGGLQNIKDAEVAIERTSTVVGECALRGEANPALRSAVVKARYNPAL